MKKKLSIVEIKNRIVDESFELVSTEYINAHEKLEWHCFVCGNHFFSSWLNVSSGWKCSSCKSIKTSIRIREMRKNRGDGIYSSDLKKLLLEKGLSFTKEPPEFISNLGKKFMLICLSCGNSTEIRLQDLKTKTGYGCWNCSRPKANKPVGWVPAYSEDWTLELKENIRNRDGRRCQYPECVYDDTKEKIKLHVHHIDGIKTHCQERNLISLCCSHHRKVESLGSRDWEDYFYEITQDYEIGSYQ